MKASVEERYSGLTLTAEERETLRNQLRGSKALKPRQYRRIQTLLLLDQGQSIRATAEAVMGYRREVSRIAKRYLSGGIAHALSDNPRPAPAPKLDSAQQAAIVAMVCGPAPAGRSRWTVRLIAEQARVRQVVDEPMSYELARKVLKHHGLKPWREKNVVYCGY